MAQIVPSILAADFTRLGEQIKSVAQAGVSMLHVDIMDGHFVPNFTMGPPITESIRKISNLKLDHHLMIEDPDTYAPIFIKAGATSVSVHYEVCRNLNRTLNMIQSEGAEAGVVINPHTPVAALQEVLDIVDYVLVMSVNPGFGGQEFIPRSLDKVRELVRYRNNFNLDFAIEIDGGIGSDNLAEVVRAGVDWVVAGSSIFRSSDPTKAVAEMIEIASEANSVRV